MLPETIGTELLAPAFRPQLTPTWLSATALLAGYQPPDPDRPLRVLDLGCGPGVTAAVIAAAHPLAEVWAADGEPTNVERADRLATASGLANLTVLEANPTARTDSSALPASVDIAIVDDLVSTTDEAGRAALATLLAQRVDPGGLVAVVYRTRIGWSEVIPLRRLALLFAPAGRSPAGWQARAIVDLLEQLRAGGAGYIAERPAVTTFVDQVATMGHQQLTDVLLTEHLEPMALVDVAEWLAPTGATFIGSAALGDQGAPADSPLLDLLDDTQDEHLREALRDLVGRPTFRIDVFRRGGAAMSAEAWRSTLMDLELVGLGEAGRAAVDAGVNPVDDESVADAVERLGAGPRRVGELVGDGPLSVPRAQHLVRLLMGRRLAHPRSAGWATADASASCCALNRCLSAVALAPDAAVLASPVIGSAIGVSADDPAERELLARLGIVHGDHS